MLAKWFCPAALQGVGSTGLYRAGGRVHTPSRAAPPVGRHQLNTARRLHSLTKGWGGVQVTGIFGKVRLYGAVAWGLGALFMGIFNSFFGWTGNTIFYTGTSLTAVLLSMRVLSVDPPKDRKEVVSKEVLPYLMTWRSISFFGEVLVAGIAQVASLPPLSLPTEESAAVGP